MATAREFVDFWLANSVHPDEQYGVQRGEKAVWQLVDGLIEAARGQGFAKAQIETEIGDLYGYIRTSIDKQNAMETGRLQRNR